MLKLMPNESQDSTELTTQISNGRRLRGTSDASSVLSSAVSAYEMPAPLQRARCLCASVKYQNLMTNHVCPVGRDPMPLPPPPQPLAVTNEGYAAAGDAVSPDENVNVADSSDGSSEP